MGQIVIDKVFLEGRAAHLLDGTHTRPTAPVSVILASSRHAGSHWFGGILSQSNRVNMGVLLGPLVGVIEELPSSRRHRHIITTRSLERCQGDARGAGVVHIGKRDVVLHRHTRAGLIGLGNRCAESGETDHRCYCQTNLTRL